MLPNTHRGSRARRRYRSGAHRPLPVAVPPFDSIATAPPARNGESRENAGDVRMPEERSTGAGGQAHRPTGEAGRSRANLNRRSPGAHILRMFGMTLG